METAEKTSKLEPLFGPSCRISLQSILTFLGCFLLLRGNALAWPCLPAGQSYPYCYPLRIFDINPAYITLFLAIGILIILLAVNRLEPPMQIAAWLILLFVPYVLFFARLRPDPLFGHMREPFVSINRDLGAPSLLVLPSSLIVSWLALRPKSLQKSWRLATIIAIVLLVCQVSYFLVLMVNRPYQVTLSAFIERQGLLSTAPLLILAGCIFLLIAEVLGILRDRRQIGNQVERVRPVAIKSGWVVKGAYWSAFLAALSIILTLLIGLFGNYVSEPSLNNVGVNSLLDALIIGIDFLLPASVVILMLCIWKNAPTGIKIWPQIGFMLSIIAALLDTFSILLRTVISFEFYKLLMNSLPILQKFGVLGSFSFACICLALLLTLPTYKAKGIELAIRWCIFILGALTLLNLLSNLLSTDRIPQLSLFTNLVGKFVIFPVTMFLIAIVFKRMEKPEIVTVAETT